MMWDRHDQIGAWWPHSIGLIVCIVIVALLA